LISYPIDRWVVNSLMTVVTCGDATSCFDVVAKDGTNAAFSCAGFKQCSSTCGLREVSERVFPRRSGDFWVCIIVQPHGFANDSQLCNRGSAEFSQHIPRVRIFLEPISIDIDFQSDSDSKKRSKNFELFHLIVRFTISRFLLAFVTLRIGGIFPRLFHFMQGKERFSRLWSEVWMLGVIGRIG
jgi:hypothetical protein